MKPRFVAVVATATIWQNVFPPERLCAATLDHKATLARSEIGNWVATQGGEVKLAIEETGSGLETTGRVYTAAGRGDVDCVGVWKLDPWGRTSLYALANIPRRRFVAVSQDLDLKPCEDAMSRLMVTVLAAAAEFERDRSASAHSSAGRGR